MFPSTHAKNYAGKFIVPTNNIPHQATPNGFEAQWKGVLRRYDSDDDGRLSKKEVKAAFKSAGSSVSSWRAFRALRHADKNGDGFINEAELKGVLDYAAKKGYAL